MLAFAVRLTAAHRANDYVSFFSAVGTATQTARTLHATHNSTNTSSTSTATAVRMGVLRCAMQDALPLARFRALEVMHRAYPKQEVVPLSDIARLLALEDLQAARTACALCGLPLEPGKGVAPDGEPTHVRFHTTRSLEPTWVRLDQLGQHDRLFANDSAPGELELRLVLPAGVEGEGGGAALFAVSPNRTARNS